MLKSGNDNKTEQLKVSRRSILVVKFFCRDFYKPDFLTQQLQQGKIGQASTAKDPPVEELKVGTGRKTCVVNFVMALEHIYVSQMQEQQEKDITDVSAEISKLKAERQRAEEKLQKLSSEKDSLMEKLKVGNERTSCVPA